MNTPNKITVGRIVATPFIAGLIYQPGLGARWATFVLFVAAAVSDVVDGNLARDKDEITRFGQLLDPIADKLLVLVTFVPLYGIGLLPLWLVILVLGREIVITVFRRFALARGQLIAASGWGKSKAVVQNWFIGSVLVWRIDLAYAERGASGPAWEHWQGYTLAVIEVGMWFVIVLTILSLIDYLVDYRHLWSKPAG
ncbi:MAG TPA: CDP-diacylglycerol--glycerol-3-phosphate 3-phosphatidyltransferase [Gemmatimonadota bacterium]|nr:CDP-diacylglycerol--glycerol-3-phosphate 3-phosphatidyltransferase [Gemmatimonadota bacterium]